MTKFVLYFAIEVFVCLSVVVFFNKKLFIFLELALTEKQQQQQQQNTI